MALTKVKGHIVADDLALGGNPTTTTQSASDNSTKLATTAYVTTAIANLVDDAPSTLNTLNEIAAALNDDAALNTTLTNSIATKLPLAGGTLTGALVAPQLTVDNIGINGDTITFTGSSASGFIQTSTNVFQIGTSTNDKIDIFSNNAVRATILGDGNVGIGNTNPSGMHANANKLVVGTGSGDQGMSIYSGTSTGRYAFARALGNNTDAYDGGMSYDGNRNLKFHTNAGSARMTITGTGLVGIGDESPDATLHINTSTNSPLLVESTHGSGGYIELKVSDNTSTGELTGFIGDSEALISSGTAGDFAIRAQENFVVSTGGATERMRIKSTGMVYMNGATGSFGTPSFTDGILFTYKDDNEPHLENKVNHTNSFGVHKYINSNGTAGSISMFSSSVAYNTTSDYRLKKDVNYTWDATSKLKQLKPCEFKFRADSDDVVHQGFLAHEVDSIVPTSVFGEKDGDEMQQLDHSKLVPLLVKTIQELEARIATLEG